MGSTSAAIRSDRAAVVLAAGEGRRLRPLTDARPKALCPVGGVPLVDLAIDRVAPLVGGVAVNVHHGREQLEPHLRERGDVRLSIESDLALGTAGGVARLREWIDGRAAVVVNADGWTADAVDDLVRGWEGETIRVLVVGEDELRDDSSVVGCALPWSVVRSLTDAPGGLFEVVWREARAEGRLDVVRFEGDFIDCGTPARYLDANLAAVALAGGSIIAADARIASGVHVVRSVVGAGARIDGDVVDSVVWDGQSVAAGESLRRALRVGPSTTVSVGEARGAADARS